MTASGNKDGHQPAPGERPAAPGRVDVSVVICTHNRSRLLERTLRSVVRQQTPEDITWEAVIVDNASTDETADVVQRLAQECPHIRYVAEPEPGISNARNRGLQAFVGDLLCFVDDDVLLGPRYVVEAYQQWRKGLWDLAGGRLVADYETTPPAWLTRLPAAMINGPLAIYDRGEDDFVSPPQDDRIPPTCNMLLPRESIPKIGLFDPALGEVGRNLRRGEDADFCQRAQAAGLTIGYCASPVARHFVPRQRMTRRYFLRWKYNSSISGSNEVLPSDTVFWLRVPRYEWRRLVECGLGVITGAFTQARFQRLLELTGAAGTVVGYLTRQRSYRIEPETAGA
jgi:glycosyltransferase involved in cell wall biosynthesis